MCIRFHFSSYALHTAQCSVPCAVHTAHTHTISKSERDLLGWCLVRAKEIKANVILTVLSVSIFDFRSVYKSKCMIWEKNSMSNEVCWFGVLFFFALFSAAVVAAAAFFHYCSELSCSFILSFSRHSHTHTHWHLLLVPPIQSFLRVSTIRPLFFVIRLLISFAFILNKKKCNSWLLISAHSRHTASTVPDNIPKTKNTHRNSTKSRQFRKIKCYINILAGLHCEFPLNDLYHFILSFSLQRIKEFFFIATFIFMHRAYIVCNPATH